MKFLILIVCLMSFPLYASPKAVKAPPPPPPTPAEDNPNRIVLWGGYGPDGLTIAQEGGKNLVKPYLGPLMGVSYAHRIWDRFSLNGQLIVGATPYTSTYIWMGGLGWDF